MYFPQILLTNNVNHIYIYIYSHEHIGLMIGITHSRLKHKFIFDMHNRDCSIVRFFLRGIKKILKRERERERDRESERKQ